MRKSFTRHRLTPYVLVLLGFVFPGCEKHEKEAAKEHEEAASVESVIRLSPEQQKQANLTFVDVRERSMPEFIEVSGVFASDADRTIPVVPERDGVLKNYQTGLGDTVQAGHSLAVIQVNGPAGEQATVKAPQAGMVVGLLATPGDHVDSVAPILTLADLRTLRCALDVYEKDIGRIHKGQKVRIEVPAFPGKLFYGEVDYLSPRVDPETRSVKVRVAVDNSSGQLRFGMFASARIIVSEKRVIAIPLEAVQREDEKRMVFVAEEKDAFERRWIKTGVDSESWVEVTEGLKAGERIVSHGSFVLKSELAKGSMGDTD